MSEQIHNPHGVMWQDVLAANARGELDQLGLPNLRESPFDTSFLDQPSPADFPAGMYDVRTATLEGFTGWPEDSVIRGTFTINIPSLGGHKNIQAEAECVEPQPWSMSGYTIKRVPPIQMGELADYPDDFAIQLPLFGIRRVVADLYIPRYNRETRGAAQVLGIHAVEQPFDGDMSKLRPGEAVLIEGTVESYNPGRPAGYLEEGYREDPTMRLLQPDGSVIAVNISNYGELYYGSGNVIRVATASEESSSLKELTPPYALPEDKVQVAARFKPSSTAYEPDKIEIQHRASMHLIEPSTDRLLNFADSGGELNDLLDLVHSVDKPELVRKLFGNYIAMRLREQDGTVISEISENARGRLAQEFAKAMGFQSPYSAEVEREWPMALKITSNDSLFYLMRAFGKAVLLMSPAEYDAFALEFARGDHPTTDKQVADTLLYHGMNTESLMPDFVLSLATEFYDKYLAERRIEPEAALRDRYANHILKATIAALDKIPNQNLVADSLIRLTLDAFSEESPISALRSDVSRVLARSFTRCGIWNSDFVVQHPDLVFNWEDKAVEAIRYTPAHSAYTAALPRITASIERANAAGSYHLMSGEVREPYRETLDQLAELSAKLSGIAD